MRLLLPALAVVVFIAAAPGVRAESRPQTLPDPRLISIYPFAGQPGTAFAATVRGSGLAGAVRSTIDSATFRITVEGVQSEPAAEAGASRSKTPLDLLKLRVEVLPDAKPGRYPLRIIAAGGISNALPIQVVESPVAAEPPGLHDTPESAVAVPAIPTVLAGCLSRRGEADYYAFRADAGQSLTFDVISGLPQIASAGSAATVANFDPSVAIYHAEGSWFDEKRLKRIAYNDEPVWVFGRSTDAHLIHQFERAGDYLLRVEAFAGQGGPDYSYALRITPGSVPAETPTRSARWDERGWSKRLDANRLNQLAARGGKPQDQKTVETYGSETTLLKLPATVQGTLLTSGETHRTRFVVDGPADIALELETPAAAPPFFNPIVRLLNEAGEEVATNVFAGRGACSGAMTKSLQAKTTLPLRDPGEYTIEVRDATSDLAGADFQYRLQIRQQIPHIGDVQIESDHINLAPGESKSIRIMFDREEDYRGAVAVVAEALPPGVSVSTGADFEPDKDPPPAAGKRERYTPRTERAVLVFSATPEAAAPLDPGQVRVVVRPLLDGKLGEILLSKTIYLMVIAKP